MELNNIVCSLLKKETYRYIQPEYIKVQRSRIYNPDFQYIYSLFGREKELQAFELFIFGDGVQIAVYEDGAWEFITVEHDVQINIKKRYECIKTNITVCDIASIGDAW